MTVQAYIYSQPHPIKEIMTILRSWVLDLGRNVKEKMSNDAPLFDFYGNLCTLKPKAKEAGVELCFTKGAILDDESKVLESKGRKHIRSKTFYSIAELEELEEPLRHLLNEAAILNEYHYKQKAKKKPGK